MLLTTRFKTAALQSAKALWRSAPIILGIILLLGLVQTLVPPSAYSQFFSKNPVFDSVIGSALGSVLVGSPITSYILGGELLSQGISLAAVTAFIVAWVSVGVVQFPAESMMLGRRFALTRNILSFIFSIIVALLTVSILQML